MLRLYRVWIFSGMCRLPCLSIPFHLLLRFISLQLIIAVIIIGLKKTLRECALADCQVENYLAPIYPDIRTYYPKWRNDTELVSESDSD